MSRAGLSLWIIATLSTAASAQLPGLRRYTPTDNAQRSQLPSAIVGIDALRSDFASQSGGTTIFFSAGLSELPAPAKVMLTAQALWLRRHPEVVARVEGYGDGGDTRDHALAVGARRAAEVREYLLLLGVPAAQVSTTSWGKERPGLGRAETVLVS